MSDPELTAMPLVLVVDDDPGVRSEARQGLARMGWRIVEAGDGPSAIRVFQESRPDAILLGVRRTGLGGFAVCKAIQGLTGGERTPIVLVTSVDDLESIASTVDIGAADFITKPINPVIVAHRIRQVLRAKHTADALRRSESRLETAQRIARWGHYEWDLGKRAIEISSAAAAILGLGTDDLRWEFRQFLNLVHPKDRRLIQQTLERRLRTPGAYQFEHRVQMPNGLERVVRHEAAVDLDDYGEARSLIGILQDVTTRREAERKIRHLAYFDCVTGLPNRTMAKEMMRHALATACRYKKFVVVLFCDLDKFKQVNDTFGHDAGDELLQTVALRLRDCVRCSDLPELPAVADNKGGPRPAADRIPDVISRFGGDEFVIVLTDLDRIEDAVKVVHRIQNRLSSPVTLSGQKISITSSIGISIFPQDGADFEALLKHADAAMYQAKGSGRDGYQFYTNAISDRAVRRFSLETDMRHAVDRDELVLHYQPKVNLTSGDLCGVEALVRWKHPRHGMVPPNEFIPLAEETGLIVPIGEWILRAACEQAKAWQGHFRQDLSVAVNLSVRQLRGREFLDQLDRVIASTGIEPRLLELEITESVLMENASHCIELMNAMREHGVTLALDDFGTGYSSLSYLKRLPITTVKIDRTFVRDLEHDTENVAIVGATILLAHRLGLRVVAEGIENESQLAMLEQHECDSGQGYFFSAPLGAQECQAWLDARSKLVHA